MKNVTNLKSNKIESPKTPGGISKSLLTPCRRVGLSRNWKKGGPSPFVSPLCGSVDTPEQDSRKRKEREPCNKSVKTENENIDTTPSRNINAFMRKKCKLLSTNEEINCESEQHSNELKLTDESATAEEMIFKDIDENVVPYKVDKEITQVTPVSKSKSKKKLSPIKITNKANSQENNTSIVNTPSNIANVQEYTVIETPKDNVIKLKKKKSIKKENKKSPENLTKECMVIIQKRIFKDKIDDIQDNTKVVSQTMLDSDSDDMPLCQLNKNETQTKERNDFEDIKNVTKLIGKSTSISKMNEKQINVNHDVDFEDTKKVNKLVNKTTSISKMNEKQINVNRDDDFEDTKKVNKLVDKTTSISGLKSKKKEKERPKNSNNSSQSSVDDEDFDFDLKKTIIIRKCYGKVSEPIKAKSTGSIMQKDIDELRSRIEVKKKLLLAKANTEDTQELRDLIKKWQKGCQDALIELMELMQNKFPDKQNMEYSDMLQMLKIPTNLVGYDDDNDCFNTPDDSNIILSKFNM